MAVNLSRFLSAIYSQIGAARVCYALLNLVYHRADPTPYCAIAKHLGIG
jgi:hypothetical protein